MVNNKMQNWEKLSVVGEKFQDFGGSFIQKSLLLRSHEGLKKNEIADTLAKAAACEVPEPSASSPSWRYCQKLNTRRRALGLSPRAPLVSMFSS
ncbi:hypothetical protein TNCV_1896191 [Trichonephila clavipes]|nr:hypothetical protein TNCV_1896191 [Trichonephila clavipes]